MIPDQAQRDRALDPERSFLVQAPAGSGKTELLIQRYLRLLAIVDEPEEVVALTFTRKAAAEMRERVVTALEVAGEGAEPVSEHAARTWRLARGVLTRDETREWALRRHPSRLRLQTLDSLCAGIARQMPMLSAFGAQPGIAEDADALYREAAENALNELMRGHGWERRFEALFLHLDNDVGRMTDLLADMLARRDQWLRFVADSDDPRIERRALEANLADFVSHGLARAARNVPSGDVVELAELARYAANNLRSDGDDGPITTLRGMHGLPEASPQALGQWRGLATLLLTNDGRWRARVDKRVGFPKASSEANVAMKDRFAALVEALERAPGLREALAAVPKLPEPVYGDAQWEVLAGLTAVMKLAAAHLQLVFQARGQVDFIEMAAGAQRALGDPDAPTDLALMLDHRIQHLLVDEFQDTSVTQFRLLEQIVGGWQPGDGRTAFLVGDPMQSIYRFRQAEVGLYLHARRHGLGPVPLEDCRLTANFRSQAALVEWCNDAFAQVMPSAEEEDIASGAVAHSRAHAQQDALDGEAVSVFPLEGADAAREAEEVTRRVLAARSETPEGTVAILVRSRGHVANLLPRLRQAGLRFQALEIEALGARPVVQDLLALTRALLHPADRVAWLAVLRAPWCGLSLHDLHALAGDAPDTIVPSLIRDESRLAALDTDGRKRLERTRGGLEAALAERSRRDLRGWVEGAWLALGGPAAAEDRGALDAASAYFDLLEGLDEGGELSDFDRLAQQVGRLFAPPDAAADPRLQLMTIHKAKGLEFDTVIVPGLGRKPQPDPPQLLRWLELPRTNGAPGADDAELLLAPINPTGESSEPIYNFVKSLDREKTRHEQGRLLYVAATRARRRLHLIGHARRRSDDTLAPERDSLLDRLWPAVAEGLRARAEPASDGADPEAREAVPIRRLSAGWSRPEPPPGVDAGHWSWQAAAAPGEQPPFEWADPQARHLGTLVHGVLMAIGREGLDAWDIARVRRLRPSMAAGLASLGVSREATGKLISRALAGLETTLSDERGRWILAEHAEERCEYPLTGVLDGELLNVVLDRTFVDDDDVRWIVDYKTGRHEGGDLEAFLAREKERYAPQLQRYARLMRRLEDRPIRLGLYFPMFAGWCSWAQDEIAVADN